MSPYYASLNKDTWVVSAKLPYESAKGAEVRSTTPIGAGSAAFFRTVRYPSGAGVSSSSVQAGFGGTRATGALGPSRTE